MAKLWGRELEGFWDKKNVSVRMTQQGSGKMKV